MGSSESSDVRRGLYQELFLVGTVALLGVGIGVYALSYQSAADWLWDGATVIGLIVSIKWVVEAAINKQFSVDIIAVLALGGALAIGEPLAGAVIAVMLATGRTLEARSLARAERELRLLVALAPSVARRQDAEGISEIPVDSVEIGDQLVVGAGELVPVDGRLRADALLDESALTGEPMPVQHSIGDMIRSGTVNAGQAFGFTATTTAESSTYSSIVRLVEQAQAGSAPFVRLADRFALIFVPLTLALAGLSWLISGDSVRAVAVLVVATPCPLILAAPIALMSGMSQAARHGVVIKGGSALERLAQGKVMLFDKTGTLTQGRPTLSNVIVGDPAFTADDCLALAASLDQVSPHVVASAIVGAAGARELTLVLPTGVVETVGSGLRGMVGARAVGVGALGWLAPTTPPAWARQARRRAAIEGSLAVFLSVDDSMVAAMLFDDPIRADAARMIRSLRRAGIERTVLVSGDRADVAAMVASLVGIDRVEAERDPGDKVRVVEEEARNGPTIMVGDGVNDAPALAAASVGVAVAARGSSVASEAADVVLVVDRIDALADAMRIAARARRIAVASVSLGMGLSLIAMGFAAVGLLSPVAGAVLQEVIDVMAIGVALLALIPVRTQARALKPAQAELVARLFDEHNSLKELVERVRAIADALPDHDADMTPVRDLLAALEDEQLPHERAEEHDLYPLISKSLGGRDPMAMMSRSHAEIEHQVKRLDRIVEGIGSDQPSAEDVVELRRVLYGLYAVLRLHNAQEEDIAFSLLP